MEVTIIGRGYLGTLAATCLRKRHKVEHIGSEQTIKQNLTDTILWASGPSGSDANEVECRNWQERVANLLSKISGRKVRRIIVLSSGGTIYGEVKSCNGATEADDAQPHSAYSRYQLWVEKEFEMAYPRETILVRLTNPYGPLRTGAYGTGFVSKVIRAAIYQEPLTIFGDGDARRDYVYEDDVGKCLEALTQMRYQGKINLGQGRSHTQNEVINIVETELGLKIRTYRNEPKRSTDLRNSAVSSKHLMETLGLINLTDLNVGVRKTIESLGAQK